MKSICILLQNQYDMDIRVLRKAEALVAAGYQVDVLALAVSPSKPRYYIHNGVNVHTLSLRKRRGTLARYLFEYLAFFCWSFFQLVYRMRKRQYAVIDVNSLPDFLVFAAAYAKFCGAKIVFDMHEITPEFYRSKYRVKETAWVIRFLKWIEKACFNYADHILTINEPIQQLLEGRGLPSGKSTVIMNAVDDSLFASATTGSPPEIEGSNAKFVMMYHGTLTHLYGLDLSIEAFAKVHQQMPGAEFWILGGGPEKQALQRLAQKLGLEGKVKFMGTVLPQEVPHWIKRSDVGVLATRRDVFLELSYSNKISEYIIMGKCIISSRLRAIRHYFSENAFAFFEPNDPESLAKQMLKIYGNNNLRAQLIAKAKNEYAPICWDVMKKRYLDLMERMTDSGVVHSKTRGLSPAADAATD